MRKLSFIRLCEKCGYSSKEEAKEWCNANANISFMPEDFEKVYRYANRVKPCISLERNEMRFIADDAMDAKIERLKERVGENATHNNI